MPGITFPPIHLVIGREDDIAGIIERLNHPDCRLLTLVGSGGSGKTVWHWPQRNGW